MQLVPNSIALIFFSQAHATGDIAARGPGERKAEEERAGAEITKTAGRIGRVIGGMTLEGTRYSWPCWRASATKYVTSETAPRYSYLIYTYEYSCP